ncbi:unnamed protein product [Cuscuta epithymum]|uniref:CNH domain-containing protein n=1 Tax=Cuscuta epithymum TaxID=186058 RepID=A0AAV0GCX5_9ASTE|nr:unnamed protein product [Cuscuta epithymum]
MANPKSASKPKPEQESKSHSRTVLKFLAEFNLSDYSSSSILSLAISTLPDSQSLIYLGTTSGSVHSLSVNPNSPTSYSNLTYNRQITVGSSLVNSIHVIEDSGKMIVLSDGLLYLVDLLMLEPVKKLTMIKGVTALSRRFQSRSTQATSDPVGQRSNGMKLKEDGCFFAVAVGKRLIIVELVMSGSLVILKEIQGVHEGIIGLAWVDDSIFYGTKNGYYLYSCSSGQGGLLFSLPDSSGPPLMKVLRNECKVLLMMDNVSVIVDAEGQPVGGSLVFHGAPDSVGEIGSYVQVIRSGKVELYHKKSGNCVQRVPFEGEVGTHGIVADEGNVKGKHFALATGTKVICYQKVSYEDQIKDLLRKKNISEAVSLMEELWSEGEITKDMLSFVHAQVGFLLLFDLHFAEAVDHFLLSDTMQPSEIFPFIIRGPNRWSLLIPRNRYWGLHPPPAPLEKVVDDGLMALQRAIFLKKAGVESAVDEKFLFNPPSRDDLLENAMKNMIRYLEVSRFKDLVLPVKEGIDTLLMQLFRALNYADDMEKLASSDNNCVVEELETLLSESRHLRTLAFLYSSKGLSSKALAIWRILARNSSNAKNLVGENVNSKRVYSDQETAVVEASKILEESSDQDLVLQHLGWISDINQVLAVQVLISEKRKSLLSPDEVVAAIDPKKVDILLRYLQWLIEDKALDDTQFHTTYAFLLAKSALDACEVEHVSKNTVDNSIFETHVRERLQIFLQSSDFYDPEEVLDLIEGSELWMEKAILYRKLGQETLVLQILALKLEDCEAAEQYCAEIGRPDAYMQLLDMYLEPMNGKGPMFAAALRLLHNHGEILDPLQVLERLSPDMPLQLASETILRMLRARLHHHHQGQIVHNLSHALEVDASLARLDERSRHVLINDESLCDSCHARLGTKLFAMYPDDTIVCYKCFRRRGESTSVTGRNFKKDSLYKPGWLVTR